ncbi:hypothetical protein MPSEU_000366000 [Mayamaea pseudoterrestris]|nr:hypothetical protein MPSEU_000366000 [Mayamaea pseudoterrestris]
MASNFVSTFTAWITDEPPEEVHAAPSLPGLATIKAAVHAFVGKNSNNNEPTEPANDPAGAAAAINSSPAPPVDTEKQLEDDTLNLSHLSNTTVASSHSFDASIPQQRSLLDGGHGKLTHQTTTTSTDGIGCSTTVSSEFALGIGTHEPSTPPINQSPQRKMDASVSIDLKNSRGAFQASSNNVIGKDMNALTETTDAAIPLRAASVSHAPSHARQGSITNTMLETAVTSKVSQPSQLDGNGKENNTTSTLNSVSAAPTTTSNIAMSADAFSENIDKHMEATTGEKGSGLTEEVLGKDDNMQMPEIASSKTTAPTNACADASTIAPANRTANKFSKSTVELVDKRDLNASLGDDVLGFSQPTTPKNIGTSIASYDSGTRRPFGSAATDLASDHNAQKCSTDASTLILTQTKATDAAVALGQSTSDLTTTFADVSPKTTTESSSESGQPLEDTPDDSMGQSPCPPGTAMTTTTTVVARPFSMNSVSMTTCQNDAFDRSPALFDSETSFQSTADGSVASLSAFDVPPSVPTERNLLDPASHMESNMPGLSTASGTEGGLTLHTNDGANAAPNHDATSLSITSSVTSTALLSLPDSSASDAPNDVPSTLNRAGLSVHSTSLPGDLALITPRDRDKYVLLQSDADQIAKGIQEVLHLQGRLYTKESGEKVAYSIFTVKQWEGLTCLARGGNLIVTTENWFLLVQKAFLDFLAYYEAEHRLYESKSLNSLFLEALLHDYKFGVSNKTQFLKQIWPGLLKVFKWNIWSAKIKRNERNKAAKENVKDQQLELARSDTYKTKLRLRTQPRGQALQIQAAQHHQPPPPYGPHQPSNSSFSHHGQFRFPIPPMMNPPQFGPYPSHDHHGQLQAPPGQFPYHGPVVMNNNDHSVHADNRDQSVHGDQYNSYVTNQGLTKEQVNEVATAVAQKVASDNANRFDILESKLNDKSTAEDGQINELATQFESIVATTRSGLSQTVEDIQQNLTAVTEEVQHGLDEAAQSHQDQLNELADGLQINELATQFESIVATTRSGLSQTVEDIQQNLTAVTEEVQHGLDEAAQNHQDQLNELADELQNGIAAVVDVLQQANEQVDEEEKIMGLLTCKKLFDNPKRKTVIKTLDGPLAQLNKQIMSQMNERICLRFMQLGITADDIQNNVLVHLVDAPTGRAQYKELFIKKLCEMIQQKMAANR